MSSDIDCNASYEYPVRMLVYIDESGDAGFKITKGSSPTFVLALCAFAERSEAPKVCAAIDEVARLHGIKGEFKFSQSRPAIRDAFFESINGMDFCVRAIVVRKEKIYSERLRGSPEGFYSFFVKSMLRFDNGLLKGAKVIIDGSGDRKFKSELGSYLRRHTGEGAIQDVRFSNSRNDRLIQLADMCAGAVARSRRDDRVDKDRWLNLIRPRIEDIWDFR